MNFNINNVLGGQQDAPKKEASFSDEVKQQGGFEAPKPAAAAPASLFANLDISKVDTNNFDTLPDGEYLTTVDKITIKLSAKGSPLGTITYTVVDGEKAKRKEFETLFFATKEGDLNNKAIGTLAKRLGVINGLNINNEEEKAKAAEGAVKVLTAFAGNGQQELTLNKDNGSLPKENMGVLKVTSYEYEVNGAKKTGTNYNYTAKAA